MDTPGRQELQKIYADLHDEILMEIAQNTGQEYEKVAVEAARIELDKRGIDVSGPDEATAESLKWFGEKPAGPLIEIPKFSTDESIEIEEIFLKENLPFEKRAVTEAGGTADGYPEYLFYVPDESFKLAIDLLKKYYAAGSEEGSAGDYSGECPACGTKLVNVEKCTDCGLALAGNYSEFLGSHPFIKFLKDNNLLS